MRRSVSELDAAAVRRWSQLAVAALEAACARIDAANVFPVADHDTGTNIVATVRAAAAELQRSPDVALAGALRCLASGGVRGARGNSGVIVSQVLVGLADAAADDPETGAAGASLSWDGPALARGLHRAAVAARHAVVQPVEGTILTVADAAAGAASVPAASDDVLAVLARAIEAARTALVTTATAPPTQCAAGVSDAGAQGLVVLYEALRRAVTGETAETAESNDAADAGETAGDGAIAAPAFGVAVEHTGSPDGPAYEVQYLLELAAGTDAAAVMSDLTDALTPLGDSLALAGDGAGAWSVHVHVDDVGAAIGAGAAAVAGSGAMSQVRVTRFADDVAAGATTRAHTAVPDSLPAGALGDQANVVGRRAMVMADDAERAAAAAVFEPLDVEVVAPGDDAHGDQLVVVALGTDSVAAAIRIGDDRAGVTVVPARALVQAMAAVAVHDPSRREVDDTVAMAEAAAACRFGRLGVAAEDGLTIVGRANAGDVLGEIGDEIAVIGTEPDDVAVRLLDALLGAGGELVTVLHRPDAAPAAEAIAQRLRAQGGHVDLDVHVVPPLGSPVVIGVE